MKKIIKAAVALLFVALLMCSCKAQKTPIETIVVTNSNELATTENETVNQPITDNTIIPVPTEKTSNSKLDSLVNAKVDQILSKLNYNKKSGDNDLQVKYNALLKQLEISSRIGQTINKNSSSTAAQVKEVPVIKQVPYPVIQPLSKLQKLLIALGVGTAIYQAIRLFIFVKTKVSWL